jgi:hypothetical protein
MVNVNIAFGFEMPTDLEDGSSHNFGQRFNQDGHGLMELI